MVAKTKKSPKKAAPKKDPRTGTTKDKRLQIRVTVATSRQLKKVMKARNIPTISEWLRRTIEEQHSKLA